ARDGLFGETGDRQDHHGGRGRDNQEDHKPPGNNSTASCGIKGLSSSAVLAALGFYKDRLGVRNHLCSFVEFDMVAERLGYGSRPQPSVWITGSLKRSRSPCSGPTPRLVPPGPDPQQVPNRC